MGDEKVDPREGDERKTVKLSGTVRRQGEREGKHDNENSIRPGQQLKFRAAWVLSPVCHLHRQPAYSSSTSQVVNHPQPTAPCFYFISATLWGHLQLSQRWGATHHTPTLYSQRHLERFPRIFSDSLKQEETLSSEPNSILLVKKSPFQHHFCALLLPERNANGQTEEASAAPHWRKSQRWWERGSRYLSHLWVVFSQHASTLSTHVQTA